MGWGHPVGASWSKQIPDSNQVAQYLELTSTKSQICRADLMKERFSPTLLPSSTRRQQVTAAVTLLLPLPSKNKRKRAAPKSPFGMCRGEGAGGTRFLQAPLCSEADLTRTSLPATPGGLFNYTTEGFCQGYLPVF